MNILVPLAEGAEEMEAVILADVFRRAGWMVVLAGMSPGIPVCARGVRLVPDASWEELDPDAFDAIVIPGGLGGVERLRGHAGLRDALRRALSAGKRIGAICAGPLVLYDAGILDGRRAACYPGLEAGRDRARWCGDPVAQDGPVITGRGPGACVDFALHWIREAEGSGAADAVAAGLLHSPRPG